MVVLLVITQISHLADDNNPIFPSALRFDWSPHSLQNKTIIMNIMEIVTGENV